MFSLVSCLRKYQFTVYKHTCDAYHYFQQELFSLGMILHDPVLDPYTA